MNGQLPGLMIAYIGPNMAHRAFRAAITNAKALAYILASSNANVLQSFLQAADEARRRSRDGNYAIGMAGGRSTRNGVQMAFHVTGNEIGLIASEPGGFTAQALGLVYREVYRVFETYLVDLFEEISLRDKRVLFSNQKISHEEVLRATDPAELQCIITKRRKSELTRVGFPGLEKTFNDLALPIVPMEEPPSLAEQQDVRRRLRLLSAIRNIIEHNRSVVNQEFIRLVQDSPYSIGEAIAISITELGDALAAVEWTADQMNKRAIDKFSIGS